VPDQEADPGFTVVDRRRRGVEDSAPPSREPAPRSAPAPPAAPTTRGDAGRSADPGFRADLTSLCMMLYSEALVHLGQVPDPATGQVRQDLDQARFTIDLLGVIQQKTEGNRTPDESAILDEMLAALRMAFVRTPGLV
jgi:Domain of unknown function (DUF1844)